MADRMAALAHGALIDELETWPKPGLVSPVDAGSHADMDAALLRRSAAAIRPHFAELFAAGARRAPLPDLRGIGLRAEAAMLAATGGVNAHRGAIFSLGLICAGAGAAAVGPGAARQPAPAGARDAAPDAAPDPASDRAAEACMALVGRLWGSEIARAPASAGSHGGRAARRYGVRGAAGEAARGFPTVRAVGLPALRRGRALASGDAQAARVECLFAVMAVLDDTNLLHRGGPEGLSAARAMAACFLAAGGVGAPGWRDRATSIHRAFVAARLSPGGSADLLAATLLVDALGGGG